MNFEELNSEMGRNRMTISKLSKATKIGKKCMYSRFSGKTEFKLCEIILIAKVLKLTPEKILSIFFASLVS